MGTPAPQNRGTELDKLTTQQPWDQIGLFPAEANRTQTFPCCFLRGREKENYGHRHFKLKDKLE